MVCPKCGRQLLDDSAFCPECGEHIVKSESIQRQKRIVGPDAMIEDNGQVYWQIDQAKIRLYLMWARLWTGWLLSAFSLTFLTFLAFDINRLREENIGLFFLPKEDRINEYMEIIFSSRFEFSPWTKIFFICFVILIVIASAIGWLIIWLKKRGIEFEDNQTKETFAKISKKGNEVWALLWAILFIILIWALI